MKTGFINHIFVTKNICSLTLCSKIEPLSKMQVCFFYKTNWDILFMKVYINSMERKERNGYVSIVCQNCKDEILVGKRGLFEESGLMDYWGVYAIILGIVAIVNIEFFYDNIIEPAIKIGGILLAIFIVGSLIIYIAAVFKVIILIPVLNFIKKDKN